jgi:hypothetical protein
MVNRSSNIGEGVFKTATDATVAADRALAGQLPLATLAQTRLGQERSRWADLHATSAEDAGGVDHRTVEGGGNVAGKAPARKLNRISTHNFITDPGALPAQNTILMVADKEGVVILEQGPGKLKVIAGLGNAVLIGIALQVAGAIFIADNTAQRVIRDKEVNNVTAQLGQLVALGADN